MAGDVVLDFFEGGLDMVGQRLAGDVHGLGGAFLFDAAVKRFSQNSRSSGKLKYKRGSSGIGAKASCQPAAWPDCALPGEAVSQWPAADREYRSKNVRIPQTINSS